MRFFVALLLTVAIDAVKALLWICAFGLLTWQAISIGFGPVVSVLGGAAVTVVLVWLLDRRLHLSRRYRDLVFSSFGFGEAPSHPLASTIAGQAHAKSAAFAYTIAVTLVLTIVLIVPIALIIARLGRIEFEQAVEMVIWLELLLGAPTLLAVGYCAHDRARSELVTTLGPPGVQDDQPDLSEHLRERWRSEIAADTDNKP